MGRTVNRNATLHSYIPPGCYYEPAPTPYDMQFARCLSVLPSVLGSLLKTRRKIVLFAAACLLAGSLTVFVAERGYFFSWFRDRDMRGEDRVFLDDLLQKQNQENVLDTNPIGAIQSIGQAAMIGSGNDPAQKAELVINSQIVKRAELVVRSGTLKRAGLVQGRH
jgi:hypothetical protein